MRISDWSSDVCSSDLFAKGNIEAIVESSKIAAKGFEALSQDSAEYGRKSFEDATATLKQFAAVKSPAEFFKLQSAYVRSAFAAVVAKTSSEDRRVGEECVSTCSSWGAPDHLKTNTKQKT